MSQASAEAARSLPTLTELESYLSSAGWVLVSADRADVWMQGQRGHSEPQVQVSLPPRETVSDLDEQIEEAIRVIAYVEKRTFAETVNSMVDGGADTLSVRLLPKLPSGVAPLSTLHETVTALRSLVIGSAAALSNRDLVLPARRAAQVESYASAAQVSTRPGSFILDVTLPLARDAASMELTPEEPLVDVPTRPYGRLVTERIRKTARNAVAVAHRVAVGEASIEQFARPDLELGNALELEALAQMGGSLETPYQLRVSQSSLVSRTSAPTLVSVTMAERERLAQAADFLRRTQPLKGVTLEGLVVRLYGPSGAFGPGDVTVRAVVDASGVLRSCLMSLSADDYAVALHAHGERLVVAVTGDLVTRGTRTRLQNVSGFRIIEQLTEDQ